MAILLIDVIHVETLFIKQIKLDIDDSDVVKHFTSLPEMVSRLVFDFDQNFIVSRFNITTGEPIHNNNL
jgi:hypothetical protein